MEFSVLTPSAYEICGEGDDELRVPVHHEEAADVHVPVRRSRLRLRGYPEDQEFGLWGANVKSCQFLDHPGSLGQAQPSHG